MRDHAMSMKQEMTHQALAGVPPVSVAGLHFAGLPIHDWVAVATGLYVLLQIVYLLPRIWERYTGKEEVCASSRD